jgi:hypothetical protein
MQEGRFAGPTAYLYRRRRRGKFPRPRVGGCTALSPWSAKPCPVSALTDQGRALLADARAVAGDADPLKARARSLAGGPEPELSVAVDVMFPDAAFAEAVAAFQKNLPATLLRFDVESSAVIEPVLDGRCAIGGVGSWAPLRRRLPAGHR